MSKEEINRIRITFGIINIEKRLTHREIREHLTEGCEIRELNILRNTNSIRETSEYYL